MQSRRDFLRTTGAGGVIGLVGLAGCTSTTGSGGTQAFGGDGEINMSLSPSVPQESLNVQYGPIRDHLESYVEENAESVDDITAEMNIGSDYTAVIEALGSGTADLAETGPFAAALGVKAEKAEIILQRKGYGTWTYKSIIAAPADSDIQGPGDLAGKRVAFADKLSTSGALYPLFNIKQAGVDIGNLPAGDGSDAAFEAVFAGGHVSSYNALKQGQVDAAGMGGFIRDTGAGPSTEEFKNTAKTIQETTGLPRAPIVVSPQLSDEMKSMVQEAFLNAPDSIYYGQDGESGTDDDLWFSAVREATVEDYQSVIDVANELGVGADYFQQV